MTYTVLIVVCCFYALNLGGLLQWETIEYRSGFIAISHIPFIVLLSSKWILIGFFTGVRYERLIELHAEAFGYA
jgi:hypothetical protein